jgi:hypothetical protein
MSSFSLWCCIGSFSGILIFKTPIVLPNSVSWVLLMVAITLCGFGSQLFLTMGLQRETASRGSLGIYTQITFAEISDRIIFHSKSSVLSLIGTGVILTSAVYVVVSDCHHHKMIWHELIIVNQLMKSRKNASSEASSQIRNRSIDELGAERLRLGAIDVTHEELRGLVSDDYNERLALESEDPRKLMENG